MKYIILNDLQTIKKSLKIIILYCGILVFSIFILSRFQFDNEHMKNYSMVLGLSMNLKSIASISFGFLNILFTFYLTVLLFTKDILIGNANLFLRIDIKKWAIYKIFILFLEIFLIKYVLHLLVGLCCNITPIYVTTDILFSFSIALMIIIFLIITQNYSLVIVEFSLLFYIICYYQITIIKLLQFHYYIGFIIIFEISILLLFWKKIIKLFNLGGKI